MVGSVASANDNDEYVWYVAYGSNLSEERFRCYIEGGTPPGGNNRLRGARDKSPAKADKAFTLPHHLHFAGRSITWGGGGVAYLDHKHSSVDSSESTLARAYLISASQFEDVVAQESGEFRAPTLKVADFEKPTVEKVSHRLYGTVRSYGVVDGYPMVTCTGAFDSDDTAAKARPVGVPEQNAPSMPYLWTIAQGIRESHGLDDSTIATYLASRTGVDGQLSAADIEKAIGAQSPDHLVFREMFDRDPDPKLSVDDVRQAIRQARNEAEAAARKATALARARTWQKPSNQGSIFDDGWRNTPSKASKASAIGSDRVPISLAAAGVEKDQPIRAKSGEGRALRASMSSDGAVFVTADMGSGMTYTAPVDRIEVKRDGKWVPVKPPPGGQRARYQDRLERLADNHFLEPELLAELDLPESWSDDEIVSYALEYNEAEERLVEGEPLTRDQYDMLAEHDPELLAEFEPAADGWGDDPFDDLVAGQVAAVAAKQESAGSDVRVSGYKRRNPKTGKLEVVSGYTRRQART